MYMYVCMYVCVYIYIYIYICIHTIILIIVYCSTLYYVVRRAHGQCRLQESARPRIPGREFRGLPLCPGEICLQNESWLGSSPRFRDAYFMHWAYRRRTGIISIVQTGFVETGFVYECFGLSASPTRMLHQITRMLRAD